MNEEQIEDLKQFIDSRISQVEFTFDDSLGALEKRIDTKLQRTENRLTLKIEELRQEMLEGFAGVGEAIEEINKHFDERLAKLEHQLA